MNVFVIQNRYDGYEATEAESVYGSLESALEKLKGKYPKGVLNKDRKGYKSIALNEWRFNYRQYDDCDWSESFYSIKEFKVN